MRAESAGIRGVNLGNWLVLEWWMGASPLSACDAEDDHALLAKVPADRRARLLQSHYASFVTEDDFAWLAQAGVNLVRIPVPYHLFGTAHHVACVKYLDQAFAWARRHDLGILLDLHTVPLSQNGFDNGGYTGLCAWARDPALVRGMLDVLERIAWRYAGEPALWGIEPLNEPASWPVLVANLRKNRHHLDRVLRSRAVPRRLLAQFYQDFYDRVRPVVGAQARLVFHDHFNLRAWDSFDPGPGDANVWLDTHRYLGFADKTLPRRDLFDYLELAGAQAREVERAARYHPVLVGEWSLANHAPMLSGMDAGQRRAWYRELAQAQLAAWDRGGGSCFWSYKVAAAGRQNWSFRDCVELGWMDLHEGAGG